MPWWAWLLVGLAAGTSVAFIAFVLWLYRVLKDMWSF